MINYFFKRLFTFVLSLALASIVIFSLVEIAPGDPASFMLGINAQEDTISALRAELGLGDVQDTVDSQNDLTAARTELTRSIVNHNIAKLEFWRDVGLLYVRDDGSLEEGVTDNSAGYRGAT